MRSAIPTFELLIVATLFLSSVAFEGGLAIVGGHCFADLEWEAALKVAIDDHRPRRLPLPNVDWMSPRRRAGRQSHGIADATGLPSLSVVSAARSLLRRLSGPGRRRAPASPV